MYRCKKNGWAKLRKDHPGKYESSIAPAPAPEDWVKLKLVLEGKQLRVHVNGLKKPTLEVELLNSRLGGKVGLWVGNNSEGGFQNLRVAPRRKQVPGKNAAAQLLEVSD